MRNDKWILKDGIPVECRDILVWAKWFEENRKERIVKQDTVGNLFVSTVFLGLDYGFFGGKPILYETMIFDESKGGEGIYSERYCTKEESLKNHEKLLVDIQEGKDVSNYN